MEEYLRKPKDSQIARYTFNRPSLPPVVVVRSYESVLEVLKKQDKFTCDYEMKLRVVTNNVKPNSTLVRRAGTDSHIC